MSSVISYSLLREFVEFLENLAHYKNFASRNGWSEPDVFIREIVGNANRDLTPSMKADLKLLVKDTILYTYPLYAPDVMGWAASFSEYSTRWQKMDAQEYITFFLDNNGDELIGEDDDGKMKALEALLSEVGQGDKVLTAYQELKRYPEEQINRARSFFSRLYEEYFQPYESRIESFLKSKARNHEILRKENPDQFEKELIKISLDTAKGGELVFDYLVSYLAGGRLFYTLRGTNVLVCYNYQMEKSFDPSLRKVASLDFFKALADDSRLSIIRALAEKPRYSTELAKELNLTRGTLSHHMGILNRFNIFQVEMGESKRVYYSLDKKKLEDILNRFIGSL